MLRPSTSFAAQSSSFLPFPPLPTSYDSQVSLFFPLSSFSLSYREYFSANASLLRRDRHFASADVSEYLSYQPQPEPLAATTATVLNATASRCSVHSVPPQRSLHLFFLPSSSILQLLTSVVASAWRYEGVSRAVRNVTAHHWRLANATVTAGGELCTYNASVASGEQCTASVDNQPSFSHLIDQTTDLSSDVHYSYSDVSLDYHVQQQPVFGLDGSVPLRVVVSGRRSDRPSRTFTHYFDWLQFQPLDPELLYVDTSLCSAGGDYAPAVPRSISAGDELMSQKQSALPKLPKSFTMLVEQQTAIFDNRTNQHEVRTTGSVLWTRLSDALESTQYLDASAPLNSDSNDSSELSSTTLFYNYSSTPPLVWNVNATNCSVQRVTPWNSNPLASPVPVTFLALFKSNFSDVRHLAYEFVGMQRLHGVMCMHYRALKQMKLADPNNFWMFNSSVYLAPPSWQHPDQGSYQLPVQMVNTGSHFHYPDKKNKTSEHNHDDDDSDEDDDDNEHGKRGEDGDEHEEDGSGREERVQGRVIRDDCKRYGSNCTTPSSAPPGNSTYVKEPCLPQLPSTRRSFSEVWDIYGLFTPASLQPFDIEALDCPTALTPHFPPTPPGYSSGVVVSSSLTTHTYAYTEYVDVWFGQRVDGRFHGRDTIEVTHRSGQSVLYDNPLLDEAAYGYGSRQDYSTHPEQASYTPAIHGPGREKLAVRGPAQCKRHGRFPLSQLPLQQFISPSYLYYLAAYPPATWVHADPALLDGMLVDQWQAINQSTTVDGDLIFDTAIFYFSHPDSMYDGQVPLRFDVSKVRIAVSSDEAQTVLESTVVDFLQWSALDCSFACDAALFTLPPVHDCPNDTYEARYATLFSALASPAQPLEYVSLPPIPSSFTAIILTALNESSSALYALRWYVDEENERDRLDWAPVNSHASSYPADHHSFIYNHEQDWGAYQLNVSSGCASLNMSQPDALNPLLLHHSGTLPDFFDGGFDGATVLQSDKVDGVDVVCFQRHYHAVLNRYTNRTYSFARQACFAQQGWVAYPSGQQQQLTSVLDSGSFTYWSSESQSLQSAEFVADYNVLFVEAEVPAAALFNLTSLRCAASGITFVEPDDDDDVQQGSVMGQLSTTEALGLAVLAGVTVTALVYGFRRSWQRRQKRSFVQLHAMHEPLHSLSTHDSAAAEIEEVRDGLAKPLSD